MTLTAATDTVTAPARPRRWGAALLCAATLSGCSVSGLQFRDDQAFTLLSPKGNGTLHLPVTLRWHLSPSVAQPAQFAVYVERDVPRPGESLPKPEDRTGVYLTTGTTLTLTTLPLKTGDTAEARETYEVTVILVDAQGRRPDERALVKSIRVKR